MKTSGMAETAAPAQPKKRTGPITFLKQVQQEGRKVTWTSRKETTVATIMVVIMVVVAAVFFYITDALVSLAVRFITDVGAAS